MAFDDPSPTPPARQLSVVRRHDGWAIKHGDGFLGMSACREEALRLMRTLLDAPRVSARPR